MDPVLSHIAALAPSLAALAPAKIFVIFATFARVGAMFMTAPAFGDASMAPIARLGAAFVLSLALAPVVAPYYPPEPATPIGVVGLIGGELLIGVFLGFVAKTFFAALNVAGQIAAMQIGLSAAQAFDPTQQVQGAIIGGFLAVLAATLVFVTDLHHVLIAATVDSYRFLAPGVTPAFGDMAQTMLETLSTAFSLGLRLAAPFVVFGVAFYAGAGVLARLMPQVQVFFILMPGQVLAGLLIFAATAGLLMTTFLGEFEAYYSRFLG